MQGQLLFLCLKLVSNRILGLLLPREIITLRINTAAKGQNCRVKEAQELKVNLFSQEINIQQAALKQGDLELLLHTVEATNPEEI